MRIHPIALLCLLLNLPAPAGSFAAVFPTRVESVDSTNFPVIKTSVTVFTRQPVGGLKKDDFVLKEDGREVSDFSIRVDDRPIYLVLVLDRSGSMAPAMPHLKRAAFEFLDQVEDKALCELISFSSDVERLTGFSDNPPYIKRYISQMRPYGATALYDAVARAVDDVELYPSDVRRIVVAFTDGRDQNATGNAMQSSLNARALARKAYRAGVPLYFIGLGREVNTRLLKRLAELTGGGFLHSADRDALRSIFDRMAVSLKKSLTITYSTPRPQRDGSKRRIQVFSRRSGKDDQGRGWYRAPSEKAAKVAKARRPGAEEALGQVLTRLASPGKFGVHMDEEISGWATEASRRFPLKTSMDLKADISDPSFVSRMMDVSTSYAGRKVNWTMGTKGPKTYLAIKPPEAPRISVEVKAPDLGRLGPDALPGVRGILSTVLPWDVFSVDAGARNTVAAALEQIGKSYVLSMKGADRIEFTARDGSGKSGVITFDPSTHLPVSFVSKSGTSGPVSTIRYSGWLNDVVVPATVPSTRAEGAGLFALRCVQELSPAIQMNTARAAASAEAIGAIANMMAERSFNLAMQNAASQTAFWEKWSLDFEKNWAAEFEKNMRKFDEDMNRLQENLVKTIAADTARFEKDMAELTGKIVDDAAKLGPAIQDSVEKSVSDSLKNLGSGSWGSGGSSGGWGWSSGDDDDDGDNDDDDDDDGDNDDDDDSDW